MRKYTWLLAECSSCLDTRPHWRNTTVNPCVYISVINARLPPFRRPRLSPTGLPCGVRSASRAVRFFHPRHRKIGFSLRSPGMFADCFYTLRTWRQWGPSIHRAHATQPNLEPPRIVRLCGWHREWALVEYRKTGGVCLQDEIVRGIAIRVAILCSTVTRDE